MLELVFRTPWPVLKQQIGYRDIQRYLLAIDEGWMWVETRPKEQEETWEEQFERARKIVNGKENNR